MRAVAPPRCGDLAGAPLYSLPAFFTILLYTHYLPAPNDQAKRSQSFICLISFGAAAGCASLAPFPPPGQATGHRHSKTLTSSCGDGPSVAYPPQWRPVLLATVPPLMAPPPPPPPSPPPPSQPQPSPPQPSPPAPPSPPQNGVFIWTKTPSPPPPPSSRPIVASSKFPVEVLWALLPVCVLLVAALVLTGCCSYHVYRSFYRSRILRDRANLRISRDRAHDALQIHLHQSPARNSDDSLSSSATSRHLPSLPPGPPSGPPSRQSSAGSDMDVGRRTAGSDIDVGRSSEGCIEFGGFRLQLTPTPTPTPVEAAAGRQWYNYAPSRLARSARAVISSGRNCGAHSPGRSSGPDRRRSSRRSSSPTSPTSFTVSELQALAEIAIADDETVLAALHEMDSPRHVGGTSSSMAQPPHCSSMPARAQRTMQMRPVPEREMAELAVDKETVAAPDDILQSADILEMELRRMEGERLAKAPVIGPPRVAFAGRRPGHSAEAKQANSFSATSTTDSYRSSISSISSELSGPGSTAMPALPLGAPAVPPATAPPASTPSAPSCFMPNSAPPAMSPPLPANVKAEWITPQELRPIAPYAGAPTILFGTNSGPTQPHSTRMQVHTSHGASMPAHQLGQPMQPHAFRRYLPATLARCGVFLQDLSGVGADTSSMHAIFAMLFTPKHPDTLPKEQWLSYTTLFSMVHPYAPGRVWKQGRRNLKQQVIEWCKPQPVFAGLEESDWCMRMKEFDEKCRKERVIFMFSLACNTPHA